MKKTHKKFKPEATDRTRPTGCDGPAPHSHQAHESRPASPASKARLGIRARAGFERVEGVEHGLAVLEEDPGPEGGVGPGDSGPVAIGPGGQREQVDGTEAASAAATRVRQVARQGEAARRAPSGSTSKSRQPRPDQNARARSRRSGGVSAVGVSTQERPSNRSARANATPCRSDPAIGWAPTKQARPRRVTLDPLDDPGLRAPRVGHQDRTRAELERRPGCPRRSGSTGVQTTTTSASAYALGPGRSRRRRSPRAVAPRRASRRRDRSRRRDPPSPFDRKASPIDPPIRPTPTIATVPSRSKGSTPSSTLPAEPGQEVGLLWRRRARRRSQASAAGLP